MRCWPTWRKPQTPRHAQLAPRLFLLQAGGHSPGVLATLPQTEGNTLFAAGELHAAEGKYVAALELVGAALSVPALSARPDMGDLLTRAHSLHAKCHLNLAAVAHKARARGRRSRRPDCWRNTKRRATRLEALTTSAWPCGRLGTHSVASSRQRATFAGKR